MTTPAPPFLKELALSWLDGKTLPGAPGTAVVVPANSPAWHTPFEHRKGPPTDRRRGTWTPWSASALWLLAHSEPESRAEFLRVLRGCLDVWQAVPAERRSDLVQATVRPGITVGGLWGLVALSSACKLPHGKALMPDDHTWVRTLPDRFRSMGDLQTPRQQKNVWETLIQISQETGRSSIKATLATAYVELETRLAPFAPQHAALWADLPHSLAIPLSWRQTVTLAQGLKHLRPVPLELRLRWLTGILNRLAPTPGSKHIAGYGDFVDENNAAWSLGNSLLNLLKEGASWPPGFQLPEILQGKLDAGGAALAQALRSFQMAAELNSRISPAEDTSPGRTRARM